MSTVLMRSLLGTVFKRWESLSRSKTEYCFDDCAEIFSRLFQLLALLRRQASGLTQAGSRSQLRAVEGRVALRYWQAVQSVMPETFDFQGRVTKKHQCNASDPVNLALNYAYGVLEGECRRAINSVGLEPSAGFLHDFADYQPKQSLVYDLQEPYRWLGVAIIQAFESGLLDMKDFYFMGDTYLYHIEIEAKRRFLELLKERFNSPVQYEGKTWQWNTIIPHKVQELCRFLLGKVESIDFTLPNPSLERSNNLEIRNQIMRLNRNKALQLGINPSTLHYLHKRAKDDKAFKVYSKVLIRIVNEDKSELGILSRNA